MYFIKEMPKKERPRERLMIYGVGALTNEELLALLIRSGTKDLSVMELSKHILYHLEHITDLKNMKLKELTHIPGIKEAKATTILAAIELGKRLSSYQKSEKKKITEPLDVYHILSPEIGHLDQEHFICFYLNTKSEIIHYETIFIGTINQTLIHPREILSIALKLKASAVLFAHNHPTGDSYPSKADMDATEKLKDASRILGIDLVDHIIIGHHQFYSMKASKKIHLDRK